MMANIAEQLGAAHLMSAVNAAAGLGASDTLFSGNATVTAVQAAVKALAPVAGGSPDLKEKVSESFDIARGLGVIAETHSLTTLAGARTQAQSYDPALSTVFQGCLAQ